MVSDVGSVFDGTVLYWLFGLVPLEEGASWRFPTWSLTPTSAEVRISGTVRVGPARTLSLPDGTEVSAHALIAAVAGGEVHTWVTSSAPFLVRQEMVADDGSVTPVIELVGLRPGA